MIDAIKNCLIAESQTLKKLSEQINDAIVPFLERISSCKGKRCFTGVGKSLMVARKIASSFSCVGYASIDVDPLRLLHGDLGFLDQNDLLIAVSNSGETEVLISALTNAKHLGIDIISITGNKNSTVANMSSHHILVKTDEAGAFGLVPSSSATAVMALGDALLCGLIKRDNLSILDFQRHHPEGSLGRIMKEPCCDSNANNVSCNDK